MQINEYQTLAMTTLNKDLNKKDVLVNSVMGLNGEAGEAIDIVKNNVDDSILGLLLDLNMPEVDGFAVLEYFKDNNLFKRIPVCIITGDVQKDRIDRAFNYDIVDVLAKPFTFESVREEVEKIINLSSLR